MSNNGRKFTVKVGHNPYDDADFTADCPNYPFLPTILPKVERIIVMGDIHGDYSVAIKSFQIAKLIDDNLNWIAIPKNTIVVQVGDQIDSCRPIPNVVNCRKPNPGDIGEDMKVMAFFDEMHKKAIIHGGAVYSLIGNHELLNSQGNFNYVSYENLENFKYNPNPTDPKSKTYLGSHGRDDAFAPGGDAAKMMACGRNSVMIIGSNIFAHAGILPPVIQYLNYLAVDDRTKLKYLNSIVRKWLLNKLTTKEQTDNVNKIVNDINGIFWTRKFGTINENNHLDAPDCIEVKDTLDIFKVGQIIVGHSPQFCYKKKDGRSGINGTCHDVHQKKRLYRVDNGLSRAFDLFRNDPNVVQVLEILDDTHFNIITDSGIIPTHELDDSIFVPEEKEKVAEQYGPGRVHTIYGGMEIIDIDFASDSQI